MKTDKFKFVLNCTRMNEWPSTSSIAENFRKYSRKYDKKKLNVSQLVVNFKMWIPNKESIFSTKFTNVTANFCRTYKRRSLKL